MTERLLPTLPNHMVNGSATRTMVLREARAARMPHGRNLAPRRCRQQLEGQ